MLWFPHRGAGTLIPSAQRLVWAAKQALGNAALGLLQNKRSTVTGISIAAVLGREGDTGKSVSRLLWLADAVISLSV